MQSTTTRFRSSLVGSQGASKSVKMATGLSGFNLDGLFVHDVNYCTHIREKKLRNMI